jgi:hypothetical protein
MLEIFFSGLSRPLSYSFVNEGKSLSSNFDQYTYQMQATQWNNMTATPVNSHFDIYVTGTTNLTSTLMAPVFASNGHYQGITSVECADSIPIIRNTNGDIIAPSQADVSFFNVEPQTGLTFSFSSSIQNTLQLYDDYVFF